MFSLLGDPGRGESFFTIITYVLLVPAFAFCIQSYEQARGLFRAVCIAAAAVALYGIIEFLCLQAFGISPLGRLRPAELRNPFAYICSTMGNSNFLGRFLVLVVPMLCACAAAARRPGALLMWAGGCVVACTALVLTYSRASLLGLAVGGIVFAYLARRSGPVRRLFWLPATALVVIVLLGAVSFTLSGSGPRSFFTTIASRAAGALDISEGDGLGTRLFTWQRSIPVILERPWFGHGPDTGFDALLQVNFEKAERFNSIAILDRIHNNYLDIALTQGLVGLASYLAILAVFMSGMLRTIRAPHTDPEARMLLCALAGGFAGCCVNDIFTFSTVSVSITFWSLIGLGCAIQSFQKQ